MTNDTFTEPERYVIQNWAASRQLELAMEKIRENYTSVGQRVVDAVRGAHVEIDWDMVRLTQHWGKGFILVGRKAWESPNDWASGFSIDNLRLEVLSDESEEQPSISVWFNKVAKLGINETDAIKTVHNAAKNILSKDEMKLCKLTIEDNCGLIYDIPRNRRELMKMLMDGNSQAFVDCLVEHLEVVLKFTPVLDNIFQKK